MMYAARSGDSAPSTLGQLVERLTANELHHHEEVAIRAEQLENGGDLGVVQPGENRRFGAEPRHDLGVREIRVQRLDGDVAMERLVYRFVDDAGATASELANDSVLADGPANHHQSRATRGSDTSRLAQKCAAQRTATRWLVWSL